MSSKVTDILNSKTKDELKSIAAQFKLPVSGSKHQVLHKVLNHLVSNIQDIDNIPGFSSQDLEDEVYQIKNYLEKWIIDVEKTLQIPFDKFLSGYKSPNPSSSFSQISLDQVVAQIADVQVKQLQLI